MNGGAEWELELFGRCHTQFEYIPFLNFSEAVSAVLRGQTQLDWDPQKPPTRPASLLYDRVRSMLSADDARLLGLYCTIGTALDYYHGTDAIFVINPYVVRLDAALGRGPKKEDSTAFIITPRDIYDGARFAALTEDIAHIFNTRNHL